MFGFEHSVKNERNLENASGIYSVILIWQSRLTVYVSLMHFYKNKSSSEKRLAEYSGKINGAPARSFNWYLVKN